MTKPMANGIVIGLTTVSDLDDGKALARSLIRSGLVACVNLVAGATSLYWWKGALAETTEVLLVIKTTADRLDLLRAELAKSHPYEVPEFLALDVIEASPEYAAWVRDSTRFPLEER